MPFKETCRVEERVRMLSDYETGNWSVSDLVVDTGFAAIRFTNGVNDERAASRIGLWIVRTLHCIARTRPRERWRM